MSFADYSSVKVGSIILLEDKYPCKLVEVLISKPGKHGSSKKSVVGIDIITDKKYTGLFRASSIITVPIVNRQDYIIMNIDGNQIELLDSKGETKTIKVSTNSLVEEMEKLMAENSVQCTVMEVSFGSTVLYRIMNYKIDE